MVETWLALDPGGATGWSIWRFEDDAPLERVAYGVISGGLDGFKERCDDLFIGVDRAVCERFRLDARTESPDLEAVQVEGAVALACHQGGIPLHWSPTARKAALFDSVLKRLGLWVAPKDIEWEDGRDVNDSAKHALTLALLDLEHEPTLRWVYPPPQRT